MRYKFIITIYTLLVLGFISSCEKILPDGPNADEAIDAPLEGLSTQQNIQFLEGAEEFDERYTAETGLGPIFVSNSCASCHGADNRGHLSTILTRFGQNDATGNQYMDRGGPQLQHFSLPGYIPEVIPSGAPSSKFIAPIVSGLGFLEAVSDASILAMADPNDADGDGISGVPNWIEIPSFVEPKTNSISQGGKYIGRFGRKSAAFNLHHQTVNAFNQDMGITTTYSPNDPHNFSQGANPVKAADPDITDRAVNNVVFYLQALQTPIQRNSDLASVKAGKALFTQIGCEKCHVSKLKTAYSNFELVSEKEFFPYTDLLLHDMGSELNDGYTEGTATTAEWRTTPLWGLGLAPNIQGGQYFLMHDGRAKSIEDAILLHGGEGDMSRNQFKNLSATDKEALIDFLKSL